MSQTMEGPPKLAWEVTKGLLAICFTVFSVALLYEVADDYQGKDLSVKWAVLTIFPAAYLWWLVDRLLSRLGVKRSAGYGLLIAVALSVWVLAASEKLRLADHAGSLVETVWGWLEATVLFIRRLLP